MHISIKQNIFAFNNTNNSCENNTNKKTIPQKYNSFFNNSIHSISK